MNQYRQNRSRRQGLSTAGCIVGILLVWHAAAAFAGTENNGRGSRAIGLGNAFVAISDNVWAVHYNPAGLGRLTAFEVSAFFCPQQFGLPELQTTALAGVIPAGFANVGIGLSRFGFELYRETQASIGLGGLVDWGVFGGIVVHAHRFDIQGYGSGQAVTIDVGLLADVLEGLSAGFAYRNLLAATIGVQNERLPQVFLLGAAYSPIRGLTVTSEVEKDIRYPLIVKAGLEQTFLELFTVRAGVSNNPDKFTAGFGVRYSLLEFGYAGYSHPQLGWTHQLDLTFTLRP